MSQINAVRAQLIIGELIGCGIDQFIIAPGFRSAPLALAAISHPSAHVTIHYDERGGAFFALGYGRSTRSPCVWMTTSGTAVANGFPAVVESAMDEVPMICLTADRPSELRDTGANQTIDQVNIFGRYTRWFADLPAPALDQNEPFIRTTIDYAVHRAFNGPVHLNCMFGEPLLETSDRDKSIPANLWPTEPGPQTHYGPPTQQVRHTVTLEDTLVQRISEAKRGLIVAGRLSTPEEGEAISILAHYLEWPLVADICAPVLPLENSVNFFDLIVRSQPFIQRHHPDVILHFGGGLVSKELQKYLARSPFHTYALIAPSDRRIDPCHVVTDRIQSNISAYCNAMLEAAPGKKSDTKWTDVWIGADSAVQTIFPSRLKNEVTEPSLVWMLSELLDDSNWIFGAGSMPIRDLQTFFRRDQNAPRIFSNRGASGIDGTLATAAGIAQTQHGRGMVLLGDLAMLHDLNSLSLLRDHDIVIIVINNNGGGIFHMLPVALGREAFEKVLGTPHDMDFRRASEQFQTPYSLVDSCEQFQEVWQSASSSSGPHLIEIQTDRRQNAEIHNRLYRLASKAVEKTIQSY